eukprot:s1242_g9.t1
MYDQLGKPQFFLTLTSHCRQPNILAAVVIAKLLRDHGYAAGGAEVEEEAAKIIHEYMINENHVWDGMTANQLCNSMPAIVARQFMHGLRQMLHWLQGGDSGSKFDADNVDEQDRPEVDAEGTDSEAAPAMDEAGRHHSMKREKPPFKVLDYIVRIEWQKRGYPHARILLWTDVPDVAGMQRLEDTEEDVDWSDEDAREAFVPTCAEDLSDKYIRTKSSYRWKEDAKVRGEKKCSINAKLATFMEHKCGPYCGKYTLGSCRFGFPRGPEAQTRWRTPQEQFGSRWKSSLAARRHKDDGMVGQYNEAILRFWRASMDLQVICELTCASKYILGYAFKSEEDLAAKRRIDTIMESFLQDMGKVDLTTNEVYQAAHAATQGRTTSTFEAVHYLLGFPTVFFSRDNEWIQVGPPSTWTLTVPQMEEEDALQDPAQYAAMRAEAGTDLPVAHRWYRHMQQNFPQEEDITFFDFVAGFRYIAKKEGEKPTPRPWPAIVAHRNFSPDLEPENFYYSKLLLHTRWGEPGDWLEEEDKGSHAAAFQRIATDQERHPDFLNSICMPKMDGTVQAARELQAVQAVMYLKAAALDMEGYGHCRANEDNYQDSLKIMQALKDRHGEDIDFMAPDTVPTGPATDVFAPVDGGQAGSLRHVERGESIPRGLEAEALRAVHPERCARRPKDKASMERLRLLIHGPGGCGKSVVTKAAAHMLRKGGKGTVLAAPTGVAAFNINGITLHSSLLLPVENQSYGKVCDVPLPRGEQLALLQSFWRHVDVLMVDELSFVSSELLDRIDKHLRLARDMPHLPFGGAALLARTRVGQWTDADIQTLQRMAFKKNDKRKAAEGAVHLFATRQQVTKRNNEYIEDLAERLPLEIYESPAADTSLSSGAPLPPEKAWLESEDTGGLEMLLRLAVGAEVMLRKNLDVPDGLVNGARGVVQHIDVHPGGEIDKVWVRFEKGAGNRWQMAHHTFSIAIRRTTAQFKDKDGNKAERRQFPLVLAKACTIHKSQAATYHAGVHARLDKHCKQEGQAYVALSRSPTQKLCTLECFDSSSLHFNAKAQ